MKMKLTRKGLKRLKAGKTFPVRFRMYLPSDPEVASPYLPASLDDLSLHDMCISTNTIHTEGLHIFHPFALTSEQCLMEVKILNGGKPLTLNGRAAWYDRNTAEEPFHFRVRIQFDGLEEDLRKKIQALIKESSSVSRTSERAEKRTGLSWWPQGRTNGLHPTAERS